MPKRLHPFDRALSAATKRRERAIAERDKCSRRLMELNAEIPKLESIICVLSVGANNATANQIQDERSYAFDPNAEKPMTTMDSTVPTVPGVRPDVMAMVPDHLKRFLQPNANYRGMGSIPAGLIENKPAEPQTEEETLPAIEGEEVVE